MASSCKAFWRIKWFQCFKLDVKSFKSKRIGSKKEYMSKDGFPMDLSDDENMVFPLHDMDHGRRSKRKKFQSCGFSRVVRNIFFQTYAAKKTRSKRFEEQSSSPNKCLFKRTPSGLPECGDSSPSEGSSGHSSRTSLFSSLSGLSKNSSSSSSSFSNICSRSERKTSDFCDVNMIVKPLINNKKKMKKIGEDNANIGLYLILVICLVGLVFSGKALAIFCTAISLFLFHGTGRKPPRLSCPSRSLGNANGCGSVKRD